MFTYSKGRLRSKGISFSIPENFSINPEPASTTDTMIEFISPDRAYYITISIDPFCDGTRYELEHYISEDAGGIAIKDIEEVNINGFRGHQLMFQGGRCEDYQLRLSLQDEDEFVINISTKHPNKIEQIVKSEKIVALIDSIQLNK